MHSPDWYPTAHGNDVWLLDPDGSTIDIRDIAKALSCQTRFAGHLREGVWCHSVAHHSVIVSHVCDPQHALIGLLHDAPEAYLQDLIRPLKHGALEGFALYKGLESRWARRIGEHFGIGEALDDLPADVKRADERVLATEVRDLAPALRDDQRCDVEPLPFRIEWHAPAMAYAAFMRRFAELGGGERG